MNVTLLGAYQQQLIKAYEYNGRYCLYQIIYIVTRDDEKPIINWNVCPNYYFEESGKSYDREGTCMWCSQLRNGPM